MCVVLAVPSASAQRDDDDEAFKAGLEARKRGRWSEAVSHMRRAIQSDDKESTRKVGRTLGFGGTEYLPYFFLGEAYYKQGDCANAVVAWTASERQGVIAGRDEYLPVLRDGNKACEAKGILLAAKFDAAASRANQQLNELIGHMERVKKIGEGNIELWRSAPALGEQYERVTAAYNLSATRLKEAQRTRLARDFEEASQAATRGQELLNTLEGDLTKAVERGRATASAAADVRRTIEDAAKLDAQIEERARFLTPASSATRADGLKKLATARDLLEPRRLSEGAVASARAAAAEGREFLKQVLDGLEVGYQRELKQRFDKVNALASEVFAKVDAELLTITSLSEKHPTRLTPESQARIDAARKSIDAARRRLARSVSAQQPAGIESATSQAQQVLAELVALEGVFGPVSLEDRGVPAWLQNGASLYFQGEYGRALDAIGDSAATGPAELHAHLFRAAAQHALFVRSGEKDTGRRDQAIAAVKRCKAIDPLFTPDAGAFSPRFLEFYEQDGVPPQAVSRTQ